MSNRDDEPAVGVLAALPRSRPHRRSDRRPAPPAAPTRAAATASAPKNGSTHNRAELLRTAVQAAAELTEIGLTASARALRSAVARLPRP